MPDAEVQASRWVVLLLHRARQLADSIFASQVGRYVPSTRQLAVLMVVAERTSPSQTEIMSATGFDRSTIAELVRGLVALGWLKRRRTRRDARVYSVRLTDDGRTALARYAPAARATEEALLSKLEPEARGLLVDVLIRISGGDQKIASIGQSNRGSKARK